MSRSSESVTPLVQREASRLTWRGRLYALITDSAETWQIPRSAMVAILATPAVVAVSGVVAALAGKQIYKLYTEEDGIAEYAQAGLYAAGCLLCVLIIRQHLRDQNRIAAVLYAVLTAGLVFMVGEELSWGQRIFGWGTPESIQALNKQEETNLHNIRGVGSTFKWVQGLVGAYGAFLPLMLGSPRRIRRFRYLIDAVVPHYSLAIFFLPMFVWRMYRNLWGDPVRYYYVITNYNEVIELILALGFFLFLVFQWRKGRQERSWAVHG
jgi:hypothetical protein